jgi:hypothetical protein
MSLGKQTVALALICVGSVAAMPANAQPVCGFRADCILALPEEFEKMQPSLVAQMDVCSFSKHTDGSRALGQCAKETVDASGHTGRGRVLLVGEEKRPHGNSEWNLRRESNPPYPKRSSANARVGRDVASFFEIALPVPLALIGISLLPATAPVAVPVTLISVAAVVTIHGLKRAFFE